MKVRNLLLAGLAVVAMTACSNENDEIVDNGQVQGTENALNTIRHFLSSNNSRNRRGADF